jgi:hypothetical protein
MAEALHWVSVNVMPIPSTLEASRFTFGYGSVTYGNQE